MNAHDQKEITIKKCKAFKGNNKKKSSPPPLAGQVQLHCSPETLTAFQALLKDSPILGASFTNPYTNKRETFPQLASQLTARELQILARCEEKNTDGVMNTALYNGLLTDNQIAILRCLVKSTAVSGIIQAHTYGGYPKKTSAKKRYKQALILVDQAGLQWQGDYRNSGGLFFYPSNQSDPKLPENYKAWQEQTFQAVYNYFRPECSDNRLEVSWNGVSGQLDLSLVAMAIEKEFTEALNAVVVQGTQIEAAAKINFRFLKAGMGFFASGIINGSDKADKQHKLECARLKGILKALQEIQQLSEEQRKQVLGKVGRLQLPFSESSNTEIKTVLSEIENVVKELGLEWGGAGSSETDDAFAPPPSLLSGAKVINACTNCADPHAMIGNEGGYSSVDAALSSNASLDHLNLGANDLEMRVVSIDADNCLLPDCTQKTQPIRLAMEGKGIDFNGRDKRFPERRNNIPADLICEHNQPLLDYIQNLQKGSIPIEVLCGSNRQSDYLDCDNGSARLTGSCFPPLQAVAEKLKGDFDSFLLADIYNDLIPGTAYQEIQKRPRMQAGSNDAKNFSNHAPLDKSKILLIYAQVHYVATQNPGKIIHFDFFDDRLDILEKLKAFFEANPALLPSNVKLHLNQYVHGMASRVAPYVTLEGKGVPDKNYAKTTKRLTQIALLGAKNSQKLLQDLEEKGTVEFDASLALGQISADTLLKRLQFKPALENEIKEAFRQKAPGWHLMGDKEGNNIAHLLAKNADREGYADLVTHFKGENSYFHCQNNAGKTAFQLRPATRTESNMIIGGCAASTLVMGVCTFFIAAAFGPIGLAVWGAAMLLTIAVEVTIVYQNRKNTTPFFDTNQKEGSRGHGLHKDQKVDKKEVHV